MEDDGAIVDGLDALQLAMEGLSVHSFVVFVGPLNVGRGEALAIVEFEPWAQAEGGFGEVGRDLGMLGQTVGELALRHGFDERVVHQIVVVLLGNGWNVV